MAFAHWLRQNSEHYLMIDAQRRMAEKYGRPAPPKPHSLVERFWLDVFAPVYRLLPWKLRSFTMQLMPGSHDIVKVVVGSEDGSVRAAALARGYHYLSWKNLNEPLLISRQLLPHADFSGSVGLVPVDDPRWIALSNGPNRSWERMRRPAWSARSVHSWKTRAHAVFPNLVALSYECSSSALQDESLLPQLSM